MCDVQLGLIQEFGDRFSARLGYRHTKMNNTVKFSIDDTQYKFKLKDQKLTYLTMNDSFMNGDKARQLTQLTVLEPDTCSELSLGVPRYREYFQGYTMKRVLLALSVILLSSGCATQTKKTRYTETGREILIGQISPDTASECRIVHNEVLEQSLLQRYTDTESFLGFYADSEKTLSIAEASGANYVHIDIPSKKPLFGVLDLNNNQPSATYYLCKQMLFIKYSGFTWIVVELLIAGVAA